VRGRLVGALDTVLDRTVVGGYTKVGHRLRSRGWAADDPRPGALRGRVVVVTGGSSGLGKATAVSTAGLGATVHLVVRDLAKGRVAAEEIRDLVPGAVVVLHRCDVSDLGSVRSFAAELAGSTQRVDVLVHNAGTLPPQRQESIDGHELTLATHVLGPLLMTELLRPLMVAAGRSRVVVVSSGGMYTASLPAADPEFRVGDYAGARAYARTKRMQVALAPLMQQRWAADGIAVHTMHPGWVDTPGIVTSLPAFHKVMGPLLRDAETGADTIVWLASTEPPPGGGQFWQDRAPRPEHYLRSTRATPADLATVWAYVLGATGLT
jgi:NAD(P)-dependent dehydrogenase (short-subunit alcohol dehydrogenase family)